MNFDQFVLHEDNHLLVINKPAGLLVQGDKTGDNPISELAKDYLKEKFNKPGNVFIGVPHRLDRPTSGCLVLTRTSKALSRMTKIFADREIVKEYWALVSPPPKNNEANLIHYIEKNESKNKVICYSHPTNKSKHAELSYKVLNRTGTEALLSINLKTGRKHQIRAQLSKTGIKIVGDLKYGYSLPNSDKSICLHCRSLSFTHPVSKEVLKIVSPLPEISEWNLGHQYLEKQS